MYRYSGILFKRIKMMSEFINLELKVYFKIGHYFYNNFYK